MHAYASLAPVQSRVANFWTVLLGVFLAIGALSWLVFSYGYIEDDAFIHLEFARSLAEGHGFTFNGQLVNGDTAPLWVLLLAAAHAMGFGWIAAAKFLCGIGVLIALCGVWRITRELSSAAISLPPAAVLLTALNPYFVHWSFSGMESVTALGVSLWAVWAVFSSSAPGWRRLTFGALLLSVAPLLRPELLLLSAVAGSALLYRAWGLPVTPARRVLTIALLGFIMVLPTILWSAYAFESFGSVIPNTNAAKRGGALVPVAAKLASVYIVGFAGSIALFPVVARRLLKPRVPATIWLLLAWPAACIAFYIADHTAVQTRYCLLSMPSFTIAVLWLLAESATAAWVRGIVAAMAVLSVGIVAAIVYPHVSNKVDVVKSVSGAAAFIRGELPRDAPIAVYSIGQLAFESRHPLIDIGGITRREVLPFLGDLPASIRWAREQGARFYIGGDSPGPTAVRVFSYRMPFVGWTLDHANYQTSSETGIYRLP